MKHLVWLLLIGASFAQNQRFDAQFPSITSIGSVPYLIANTPPNSPVLAVCNSPANGVPCTNYATTFTGAGVACLNGAQDTPQPATTSSCQSTGDAQGNIGFWAPAGTYDYTICVATTCFGPFTVMLGGGGQSFQSKVGFQAVPPALPDLVWLPDPSGMCPYPTAILTQGQPLVCSEGVGILWLNTGTGPPTQLFTIRPNSTFTNGSVPQYVAQNGDFEVAPLSALPLTTAQTGDCLRFNTAGDGNFDSSNCAMEVNGIYQVAQGAPVGFGSICTGNVAFATGTGNSQVFPTATRRAGVTYFITAAASTSTVVGMDCGQNGSNSIFPILAWYRFSALFSISSTTNTRYWLGLATWNNGSATGTNSTAILNSTKFATDQPLSNVMGFRFSATTDTTFKAVSCVAAGSATCTVTDTTVTADTNPHLFEIATNSTGTSLQYFIDGVQRATITTNIPAAVATSDGLVDMFWTGDNKNTVTSPSATFYKMEFSLK